MKQNRQLGLGKDFIDRVGQPIVGKKLLQRRMQLEPADGAGRDEPSALLPRRTRLGRVRRSRRAIAMSAIRGGKREDVVVGQVRSASQVLVDGKDDACHRRDR